MPSTAIHEAAAVSRRFAIPGTFVKVSPLRRGHINETFVAEYEVDGRPRRYLHQRLNRRVLPEPELVMTNIERVLGHLHAKLGESASRQALTLIPGLDGRFLVTSADGSPWRTYLYIENTYVRDTAATPREAHAAARAFGAFERLLADLSPDCLGVTIPHFHDARRHFGDFVGVLEDDRRNRAAGARGEIAALLRREPLTHALSDRAAQGLLPERIVHNDTKLNNVLFDNVSHDATCVVDLDTVMPGLSLHDFGDLARSAANRTDEDERDLARVGVEPELFAALAQGFVEGMAGTLTAEERASMVLATKVITLELSLRFLTDYLQGDTYFRTHRPGHNLDRARCQLAMLRSLDEREEELETIVANLRAG